MRAPFKSFLVRYKSDQFPNTRAVVEKGHPPADLKIGDEKDFDGIKWRVVEIKEYRL